MKGEIIPLLCFSWRESLYNLSKIADRPECYWSAAEESQRSYCSLGLTTARTVYASSAKFESMRSPQPVEAKDSQSSVNQSGISK
jgi:hypothetical protein